MVGQCRARPLAPKTVNTLAQWTDGHSSAVRSFFLRPLVARSDQIPCWSTQIHVTSYHDDVNNNTEQHLKSGH